jgi:hypothetical protein
METIKNLCSDCVGAADCGTYLEILRQDNDRQLNTTHSRIFIMQIVYACDYYEKKEERNVIP